MLLKKKMSSGHKFLEKLRFPLGIRVLPNMEKKEKETLKLHLEYLNLDLLLAMSEM